MRQERVIKRPVRRRSGGGDSEPLAPLPTRPPDAKRALQRTDDLLRRLDRLVSTTERAQR